MPISHIEASPVHLKYSATVENRGAPVTRDAAGLAGNDRPSASTDAVVAGRGRFGPNQLEQIKEQCNAAARQIRTVMSIALKHALGLRLGSRFLLQRLAGTAMAHRVAVPVYRRRAVVGVMRRSPARMDRCHLRRVTGRSRESRSWDVGRQGF